MATSHHATGVPGDTFSVRAFGAAYPLHYNTARPHRDINLDIPVPGPDTDSAPTEPTGPIETVDVLGGLVHEYHRPA